MIEYRDYQLAIIELGTSIINVHDFLYLAMEVRTGKTLTSLGICEQLNVEHVLFLTKKKAISSITSDFDMLCPTNFILFTINYESMHKLPDVKWDVIICDEAHSLGAFAKPNKRAKAVKELIQKCSSKVIIMSGTIPNNPFKEYKNFYKFAHEYVNVTQKKINGMLINDYSKGLNSILDMMTPYTIRFSQENAGFKVKTTENVLEVDMKPYTYDMTKRLQKDLVIEGKRETILADTPVKLMMKLHQMFSGTVKFESGNSMVMDYSKAEFIKKHFKDKKIGIFYKFTAELAALKEIFEDKLTTELDEFNNTDKCIALQIVSGREGISLKKAEALVYYNIDFSATSYWQSRDRMTTKDRLYNNVYWIFSKGGIEKQIYKAVTKKKDYTINHFKKQFI